MNGLTDEEVINSKEKYEENKIYSKKQDGFFKLYLTSLSDPIIKILLIALAVKVIFLIRDFDWYETIGIVISILLASLISTISEYGSEKAFDKLEKTSSLINTKVIRNKLTTEVPLNDIVKGDIIILEIGDRIPADGMIIEGNLAVDESLINGEAKEKNKSISD